MRSAYSLLISIISLWSNDLIAQKIHRPYADYRPYYLGLQVGVGASGVSLRNTSYIDKLGHKHYAEQGGYHLGLGLGITGGLLLRPNWEMRLMPKLNFGDISIAYTNGDRVQEYLTLSSSSLDIPLQVKWASDRLNNIRPYLALGPYLSWYFTNKPSDLLRYRSLSYGILCSIGCDFYLKFIKLSPELSYHYSLSPAFKTKRPEFEGDIRLRYTSTISQSRGHYISFSLHFQ